MNIITLLAFIFTFLSVFMYFLFDMIVGYPLNIILALVIALFGSILLFMIGLLKSPMWTFMTASYNGKPLIEVHRKDNTIDWDQCNYSDQILDSKRYGLRIIAPKDPGAIEKKSGAKIYRVNDGVGQTISRNVLKVVRVLEDQYGWSMPVDVIRGLTNWHKCTAVNESTGLQCGFEGFPELEDIKEMDDDGVETVIGQDKICPKCDKKNMLNQEFPEITAPLYETLDGNTPLELFLPSTLSPDKLKAYQEYMVKASEALSNKRAMQFIAIGIMIFMILMGAAVMITMLPGLALPAGVVV